MGKKKSDESGAIRNGKYTCKDSKKEKFSVIAILASMDKKDDKPKIKKGSSSRAKTALKDSSYTDDVDYPPNYDQEDEDEGVSDEKQRQMHAMSNQKGKENQLDFSVTHKKQMKLKSKESSAHLAAEIGKRKALKDDHDAFTVVIGSKTSVLEGEDTGDANVKDIKISSFSVSVRGKELLNNASLMISHGRRYGLVGPNGKGKSTLLKLLAWRKIPVPKNIDILLVEQEVVGDGKSALETVVSANEELFKLREEAAALEKSSCDDDADDNICKHCSRVLLFILSISKRLRPLAVDCRLIAICEDLYAARAEGELGVEEVLYRTLVKIYRSPHMLLEYTKLDYDA